MKAYPNIDEQMAKILDNLTARLGSVYAYEACPTKEHRDYMIEFHLDEELEMHLDK